MPAGNEIAVYSTYIKAQQAVDALSDEGFEVQTVTIVGHDLHMVERVTGRLTYPRVAFSGFASGAWFGLFVGLLMTLFSQSANSVMIVPAMLIGGAFGLLFSIIAYALQRGKRDFTSQSQIVAARYVLLCLPQTAGKARSILAEKGLGGDARATTGPQTVISRPAEPTGAPQYGVRVGDGGAQATTAQPGQAQQPQAAVPGEATARPMSYGEALDAQRKAAREAASRPAAPAVPTAPATEPRSTGDSEGGLTDGAASIPPVPAPDSSDSGQGQDLPSGTSADSARRELSNPDNPFSAPKDDK